MSMNERKLSPRVHRQWVRDMNRHERTDQQEDQDGKNHHKRSVSIEGNRLDETRFEDFIPSRDKKHIHKYLEGKTLNASRI